MAGRCSPFRIKSIIWIEETNGKVVFGLGRYRILKAVRRLGSLQAAAQELKMSCRALWGRVRAIEERLGKPLLIRDPQGSRLTRWAKLCSNNSSDGLRSRKPNPTPSTRI